MGGWQATPRLLTVHTEVTRAVMLQDHDGVIEELVIRGLIRAMRDGLTQMLLRGEGTNESGTPPTYDALGLMNHADVHGHTYANAGKLADIDILAAVGTLTASRVDEGRLTAVLSPSGFRYGLKTARTIAELPLLDGRRLLACGRRPRASICPTTSTYPTPWRTWAGP